LLINKTFTFLYIVVVICKHSVYKETIKLQLSH